MLGCESTYLKIVYWLLSTWDVVSLKKKKKSIIIFFIFTTTISLAENIVDTANGTSSLELHSYKNKLWVVGNMQRIDKYLGACFQLVPSFTKYFIFLA